MKDRIIKVLIRVKNRKKELLWSMIIGFFMLLIAYEAMNVYWPWTGGENMKMKVCEWVKQSIMEKILGDDKSNSNYATHNYVTIPYDSALDSVMMVDVHYDKVLAMEFKGHLREGKVAVADHQKLLTFLKALKKYDNYKYIMFDVYIKKSIPQKADNELINIISSMDRIAVPIPLDGIDEMDKRLHQHAAMAKYGITLWENDFVKYPYYSDGMKSIPLKMYEDITGRSISDHFLFAWDKGFARRNVMLTYEFQESIPEKLGKILGDSDDTGYLDKPEKFKNKYILIGDFEDDRHETLKNEMSGTAINFNAFLSLLHGKHCPGLLMPLLMFGIFTLLAYLTITQNKLIFGGFWGYGTYLLIFCIIIYLLCNEVYEILILSMIYAGLKKCIELNWINFKK